MTVRTATLAAAAAGFAVFAAAATGAAAKPRKRPRSFVTEIQALYGLQGSAGGGARIAYGFTVVANAGRRTEVETQFGVDRDLDGRIADDEFRPATEDRSDSRNSRSESAPRLFDAGRAGVVNACVWDSRADLPNSRFALFEYALTQQGRMIPDVANPGAFLLAHGPGGAPLLGGVKLRVRTTWRRAGHARLQGSAWIESPLFAFDSTVAPAMTIDDVTQGPAMTVYWTAMGESEDANGNGALDVAEGEDVNSNGKLDCERVGVAFDWHRVAPGENPAFMTYDQLAALEWTPCARVPGAGDTDRLDARPGAPIPTEGDAAGLCVGTFAHGRAWTFVWDAAHDAGSSKDGLILRGTPFCEHRKHGSAVFWPVPVRTAP